MRNNVFCFINAPKWCKIALYEMCYGVKVTLQVTYDVYNEIDCSGKFACNGKRYIQVENGYPYGVPFRDAIVESRKTLNELMIKARETKIKILNREIDRIKSDSYIPVDDTELAYSE